LHGYVTNTIQKLSPSKCSSSLTHNPGAPYPLAHYVNYDKFSLPHKNFIAAITTEKEPAYFHEAVKDERWRAAM